MKRILLFLVAIFTFNGTYAQWAAMGSGFASGSVNALCVHNGELYAAGTVTNLVRKWNSTTSTWTTVGALSGTTVKALISFNGSLYAGGQFTMSGNKNNVARLSGTTWLPVGDGLSGIAGSSVNCFYNWNGVLCAGGTFNASGTSAVNRVAKLVSGVWVQLGPDVPTHCSAGVYAMTVYAGNLYVGGQGSSPNMDKLVGNTWDNTWFAGGGGPDFWVYALDVFPVSNQSNLALYIGGTFSSRMMTYTTSFGFGTSTNSFTGTGVNAIIHSPNTNTGYIFAGGTFSVLSSANASKKKFNLPWEAATSGTGLGTDVKALCFYNGNLIAGGSFTTPFNRIAKAVTTVDVEEVEANVIVNSFYPNPLMEEALLKVQTKGKINQPVFKMLDSQGKEVASHSELILFDHSQNIIEYRISGEGLAAGLYYYFISDGEYMVASGKALVE